MCWRRWWRTAVNAARQRTLTAGGGGGGDAQRTRLWTGHNANIDFGFRGRHVCLFIFITVNVTCSNICTSLCFHSSSLLLSFLTVTLFLLRWQNRETSAPFDQRFAFKFKCFLLTGSKSSLPLDDDAPLLLLLLPLPLPTLSFSHSRSASLPLSVSVLVVSFTRSLCVACVSDRLVILLFQSLNF